MVQLGFAAECFWLVKHVKWMEHLPLFIGNVMEWFGRKNGESLIRKGWWLEACSRLKLLGQMWLCSDMVCPPLNLFSSYHRKGGTKGLNQSCASFFIFPFWEESCL